MGSKKEKTNQQIRRLQHSIRYRSEFWGGLFYYVKDGAKLGRSLGKKLCSEWWEQTMYLKAMATSVTSLVRRASRRASNKKQSTNRGAGYSSTRSGIGRFHKLRRHIPNTHITKATIYPLVALFGGQNSPPIRVVGSDVSLCLDYPIETYLPIGRDYWPLATSCRWEFTVIHIIIIME